MPILFKSLIKRASIETFLIGAYSKIILDNELDRPTYCVFFSKWFLWVNKFNRESYINNL